MPVLFLSLLVLLCVALIAGWLQSRTKSHDGGTGNGNEEKSPRPMRPEGCCGLHEVCEKTGLLRAAATAPEYYDDEYLDAFRGRPADSYTDGEVEQFEYVMTTMQPAEVAGWLRSLQLRHVELPADLRDAATLLVNETAGGEDIIKKQ